MDELKPAHNSTNIMTLSALGSPERSNSSAQPLSPAGHLVQILHLGLNLPQKLKGILPKTHKICCLSAHRKIANCYFAAFFPTHYKCKHICAHLCIFLSPTLARTQETMRRETCMACWRGKKISALRKRCNKSTPIRERCLQKQTAHEQTSSQHFKTHPKLIENEMEMGKLQSKMWNVNVPTQSFTVCRVKNFPIYFLYSLRRA